MSQFGMHVKFTAKSGQRDALVAILLEGQAAMESIHECELYIVSVSDTDPDAIWVTEVWSDAEAHAASLALDETKAAIQRAMPLIAHIDAVKMKPAGGKGLRPAAI
ncbi:putative quinol monooxygenase [Paenibacillus chartarius]|uniref:Quinol monooxygenase n=1 Tax=Paenibacillus chartarius TaxID=747481 RepID=A0ABV6DSI5_9BACL